MTQTSVRPTTATTGKTVLALVAVLSLLLSLFAIASPALADHEPPDGPAVAPTLVPASDEFPGGNVPCPEGTTELTFDPAPDGTYSQSVVLSDGSTATVEVTVSGNTLEEFIVTNGLAAEVHMKATNASNIYDYSAFPGGGIAHDDGLVSPATDSISHIKFCLVPIVAEIEVTKSGPALSKVGDATVYTITIKNTGSVELFIEEVLDSLAGDLTADVIAECGTLDVGETCTFMYSYTPEQGDADPLENTVDVTANSESDFTGAEATGSASATVELFQPSITVDKAASPSDVQVGDDVNYTITITNTSSADSPDLVVESISDTLAGDLTGECAATLAPTDVCTIEYTLQADEAGEMCNTVSVETHPDGFTNEIDGDDTACVNVEGLGSITIHKEIECEECETRTPGFWFNAAGSHDDETNALMAQLAANDGGSDDALVEVNIDGTVETFATAEDVREFLDADRSGDSDGVEGLSRDGALLRHFLATHLNVLLNGEECDLLNRELNGQTVAEILEEAEAALAADDEAAEVAALEKLTAINESDDAEENPLTCGENGTSSGAGFSFDLFEEADYPDGDPFASGTTGDDGTLVFDELPFGTYVLVETGNDSGQECEIVSVEGEGATLNPDGTVTIVVGENNPDVVITVTNECEGGGDEEGSLLIAKVDEQGAPLGGATFEVDGIPVADEDEDGFVCIDALELGSVVSVEETIAPEGYIGEEGAVDVTITSTDDCEARLALADPLLDADVTFTNELEEEGGELEVIKFFCPTEGEDLIFVFGPLEPEPVDLRTLGEDELPSDEGCTLGAPSEDGLGATFTITGGDLTLPLVVMTTWDEILTLDLAPGSYEITEEGTGLSATFEIVEGGDTAVVVFNFEEEEDEGNLKILKFFCEGEGEPVFTVVEEDATLGDVTLPDNCESPEPGDATFTLTMGDTTSGEFTLGDDGARLIPLAAGTYVLNEVDPNEASSDEFDVAADGTTTVIVFDFEGEGTEGGNPPGGNGPGGEGTAGGNPTPNTAMDGGMTGTTTSALLALLVLGGLGAAGFAARAEVRRRR